MWAGRGIVFLEDEWPMIFGRRGGDLDTFLRPHNEHLVVINVVVYKALVATVGIDDYAPYRLVVALAHVACLVLVFAIARRRVGAPLAAALTAPLLVFGPGWEILIFPFGIFFLGAMLAGLGAMVALERRDRRGDAAASGLLGVALAGSSFGIPLAAGAAAALLWGADRRRRIWVVALPVALYGIWYLAYNPGEQQQTPIDVGEMPRFVFFAASGALSALYGLPLGVETQGRPEHDLLRMLSWCVLVVALAALAWWLRRRRRITPGFVMAATTLGAFWVLTGIARGAEQQWYTGRYVYPAAVFLVVLIAEALDGVVLPRRAFVAVCVVAAGAAVLNTGWLIKDGNGRRADAAVLAGELAAVELAVERVPPRLPIDDKRARGVLAGEYLATIPELGSPALPRERIPRAAPHVRSAIDALLVRATVRFAELPVAPRPLFEQEVSGSAARFGRAAHGCYPVRPPAGRTVAAELRPPPYGLAVRARDPGRVVLRFRRFGDGWTNPQPLPASPTGTLIGIPRDGLPGAWRVQVAGSAPFTLC